MTTLRQMLKEDARKFEVSFEKRDFLGRENCRIWICNPRFRFLGYEFYPDRETFNAFFNHAARKLGSQAKKEDPVKVQGKLVPHNAGVLRIRRSEVLPNWYHIYSVKTGGQLRDVGMCATMSEDLTGIRLPVGEELRFNFQPTDD